MTALHWILDPTPVENLATYLESGGGHAFAAAQHRNADSIIDLVERSGLRGRGGAGFPTGRKWRTVAATTSGNDGLPMVVNAAEGEPGTFKDRALLRRNPYRILEGACIAARAVGASEIIVAIKASFTEEIERLRHAVDEIDAAGWTATTPVHLVEGPSEYLFGEETALLEVIDGRPPFPRVTPPYRRGVRPDEGANRSTPGVRWADGPAVLVDNVETLANVVGIVRHGADWYREIGTPQSPGTIICTVTGQVRFHGVGEFAMGTPLREVIEKIGGGVPNGRRITAVLSGVSNPALDANQLDTPLTYEHLAALGSGLGSASFIVIDDAVPLRSVAAGAARFLATESCGQCEPCKRDGLAVAAELRGKGHDAVSVQERLSTVARGARCALAGQTERIVGCLLELAGTGTPTGTGPSLYPIVPLIDIVDGLAQLDLAHLDKRADWSYPDEGLDSHAWPAQRLENHPVEIRPAHIRERAVTVAAVSPAHDEPSTDPFAPLHRLDERLEARLAALRGAPSDTRSAALDELRADLDRHRHATETLIYPLVAKMASEIAGDPDTGDNIVWYPEQHEEHAARLLQRLELDGPISPRLVDELCADVHASIIELEARVLPYLKEFLDDDTAEALRITADVEELSGTP